MSKFHSVVKLFLALSAGSIFVYMYLHYDKAYQRPAIIGSSTQRLMKEELELTIAHDHRSEDRRESESKETRTNSTQAAENEAGNNSISDIKSEVEPTSGFKVVYASLKDCKKPEYLPDYKALCFHSRPGMKDVRCIPNMFMLGIRKCGTTDLSKWFRSHFKMKMVVMGDNISTKYKCPLDYFGSRALGHPKDVDLMKYAAGEIMFSSVRKRNSTHMVIQTSLQYVAFLSEPGKSKFILTLRNPTSRFISYLYHMHRLKYVYQNVDYAHFSGEFIHGIVTKLISKIKHCLSTYPELACVYMHNSRDGNLDAALQHGFYVVYLQELFKFLPKESVYINQLEEYSNDTLGEAGKILKFFGKSLNISQWTEKASTRRLNIGRKPQVLPKTIELLKELYKPFNQRLADFLQNDKWLYE